MNDTFTYDEVVVLVTKAITDHYDLAPSHQPYNEDEGEEMVENWIDEHLTKSE